MKLIYLFVGVVLIVAGALSLAAGGFSFSHWKRDVDAGPIQIRHRSTSEIPVAPIVSVVSMLAGAGLVVAGIRVR